MFSDEGERRLSIYKAAKKPDISEKAAGNLETSTRTLAHEPTRTHTYTHRGRNIYVYIYILEHRGERENELLNPPSLHPAAYLVLCENLSTQVAHVLCAKSIHTLRQENKKELLTEVGTCET